MRPPDLACSLRAAPRDFDPRRMRGARVPLPNRPSGAPAPDRHRTLEIDEPLDVAAMRTAASRMVGERDFGALGADAHGRTVRQVAEVRVQRRGDLVEVRVTANAFLRRMVRSIVAVLEIGRGRMAADAVDRLLEARGAHCMERAAPARA